MRATGEAAVDTTTPLLIGGIAASVAFNLVWLGAGARRDGYRPRYHPISALSLGPGGWVQATSFVAAGVLLLGFAVGAHAAGSGAPVAVLLAVAGVGLVGAGVLPMDPMRGYPPGAIEGDPDGYSRRHRWHDNASITVFLAIPLAAIVSGVQVGGWWRWYSVATAIVTLGLLAGFAVAYARDTLRSGLIQRSFVLLLWTWIASLALRLL